VLATSLLLAGSARAADDEEKKPVPPGPWKLGWNSALNLSQSAFSDNWAGGDNGSINWVLSSDLTANRQVNRKFNSANLLQLAFGQTSQQARDSSGGTNWDRPEKTTDLILFESVGRFTLETFVDPYVAFRLDSQFLDQSDPIGTLMFNPVKLAETAGVARVFTESEHHQLVSRLGFGFRENFARTFTDPTGDNVESFTTNDGGFEFTTDAKYPLADGKIQYLGKLFVFWPVFFNQSDALEAFDAAALASDPSREAVADYWKSPDVNLQNTFSSKLTSWLAVNLYVQWIYDKFDGATKIDDTLPIAEQIGAVDGGIRKAGQFKQTLGIGLTYQFL
jgi:hypothetical protein